MGGRVYAKTNLDAVMAELKAKADNKPMVFMNAGGGGGGAAAAAVAGGKKPVNHVFHAIMTLLTCGLWLPVWLIRAC